MEPSARSGPSRIIAAVANLLTAIPVLPLTEDVADAFATAKADLRKQGMLIEDLDLMIAATRSKSLL